MEKDQEQVEEKNEQRKKCGDCRGYFKVHFNSVGIEDQIPHDETQSMCIAPYQPILLNRFVGLMGLKGDQSPLIKSCTHFETRDKVVIARKVLDWFYNREDQIKKQSYEPLFLELANLLVDDMEFETMEKLSDWMEGKEEKLEPEEES